VLRRLGTRLVRDRAQSAPVGCWGPDARIADWGGVATWLRLLLLTGDFDPSAFVDHYETALVELLKQKQAGITPKAAPTAVPERRVVNLMDALRKSIETETPKKPAAGQAKTRGSTVRRKGA